MELKSLPRANRVARFPELLTDYLYKLIMGGHDDKDPRLQGTPLDFEHKHPVFDIELEKVGPEFSEIDDKREEYIRLYAGRVEVPEE